MCVIQGFTFNEEDMDGFLLSKNQVYSNRRVPTRVNTSRHESIRVQYESTRISTSLKQVNTSPTQVNTNQHELKSALDEST